MKITSRIGFFVLLAASLSLGGCADLDRFDPFAQAGFVAPRPHIQHKVASAAGKVAASPVAASPVKTEPGSLRDKCYRSLYLEGPKSPDDRKEIEAACHDAIVLQSY